MKRILWIIMCLTLLFSTVTAGVSASVKDQETKTVRVGFFAFDGYHNMSEDGELSGYGYEFLEHLVGYTDWKLEFVGYDKSWKQMQNMLENGDIDILTSAQKTPEREERFGFSDDSLGTSSVVLTVTAGNTKYLAGDYKNWNGMHVGMISGNSRNERFLEYAEENGFTVRTTIFDSTEGLLGALKRGDVDAAVTSNLRTMTDEWVIAEFANSPFYAMFRKDDTVLTSEFNVALSKLMETEPYLRDTLTDKYFSPSDYEQIAFTNDELNFIEQSRDTVIVAALNPDLEPLSFFKNGNASGIVGDIALEITRRSGLNIEVRTFKDAQEYAQAVKNSEVDICLDASYDFTFARETGMRLTVPYLKVDVARLSNRNTKTYSSVAVLKDSDIERRFGEYLNNAFREVVYYDSVDELVRALLLGKQDAVYLNRRVAEFLVQEDVANRLVSQTIYSFEGQLCVGVSENCSKHVYSILNKVVATISADDVQEIDRRYTSYGTKPETLLGYIYDNPILMLFFVTVLFVTIMLAVIVVRQIRRRKREAKALEEEKRRADLLSDALKKAEGADEAKSRFLSKMSHEMRTPLNAITGFLSLAKDAGPAQTQTYIDNAQVASGQLLAIINDVLDMSAIESGKMKISNTRFDFRGLIHEMTNIYLTQCRRKGIEFETKILTPTEDWLIGDRLRLSQILNNLLGNAVKFTSDGHIHLRISQLSSENNRVFMRFEITDTGCGMSEEMQSRLFRPFEQENAETAQRFGGSGLGLSIVKNLVSIMNGAIRVQSAQGDGTTFVVDLPFMTLQNESGVRLPSDMKKLHVLVVDDEESERKYMSAVLERMNVRHTCVADCDSALTEMENGDKNRDGYNICLVDWRIPGKNGLDITSGIRARYGKGVVVIVVSAYEHHDSASSAIAAGADLFMPKPLFRSALLDLFMEMGGNETKGEPETQLPVNLEGKRVLLVEDNAVNRTVADALISRMGIMCENAENGKIGLDMFSASETGYYDAILMDIQMPVMDGYTATRMIRSSDHPDARTVQIIALTANAFNEDIAKALSNGMNAHVAKPIEPSQLADALMKAFRESDSAKTSG